MIGNFEFFSDLLKLSLCIDGVLKLLTCNLLIISYWIVSDENSSISV
jgi:hypothetical protein